MNCPSCARSNRSGARFCGGCGGSLSPRCPTCGASNDLDARFCDACGGALAAATAAAEKAIARKVVTVVFADLIGSVSLHERLDAESARRVIDRYHRAMTAAVEVHGGRVVQLLGDGVLSAFGVPRVAEDDAIRAVRAGAGMQRAFRELVREQGAAMEAVGLRVAVNTGEVVVSDDETAVIGDPTNVAARLQQEARDGDVIVGEGTQRLVGDLVMLAPLGSFALRGRSESVAAFRLVSLDRPASARATAFVGRDEELRRLLAVYDAAVAAPAARLAVLLGSPGLGKSRLVAELARRAGERATVLAARCDAAGGATFAPIADALRAFLRIEEGAGGDVLRAAIDAVVPGDDAERARIAAGIGALFSGAPSSPEETFFAVRRLLAALAAVRPVVLAIDDLHWAEPLLLDLVEHLVQWSAGVRLFLLVAARPELRDARSSLATSGPLVTDVVTLGGLDAGASMQLAAGVAGASELPAALVGRVLATSEGNPLFLAELVRMLVQDGTLVREGDRWVTTVEVSKLDMPPTIQVLLAARIERLRPEDRAVLERAAVIGRHFSRSAVAELLGRTVDLDARLEALRRSELIEPDTGWFLGEPALRFHHILIRDAAYRRVLKETRAELHERFADWIEARAGEAAEHEELLGFHCEQAHRNRLDLGALDTHGRALGERASRHLGAAGRRALARDDVALAASFLGRAIACLDPQDPARADLALDWCEALLSAGEVSSAAQAVGELARFAATSERLGAWHACFTGQLAALTDPQSLRATAESVASAAGVLAAAADAAGEAKAHSVHALALARLGEIGACETALDQALAAARRARDRRRSNAVLAGAPVAALWGPSPVTRASGRCLDVVRVLRITQGAPAVEAVALRCQAVLETLRGRTDAARRMISASRAMVEELGIAQQLLESDVFAGLIELLQGDAEAAEAPLRSAYEGLRARGLGIDAARAAALLGRALLAQGRAEEAEALSHESEALGGDDLKAAIAWRGVRAEALAKRGETEPAVEFAQAAVAIASATDALLDHADARMALATALRAAGRSAEAAAEERRAVELWATKGATLLTARVSRPDAAAEAPANVAPLASDLARIARPRIRPNAATENGARVAAAAAARNIDAFAALHAGDAVEIHHQTGAVLDAAEARRSYGQIFAMEIEELRVEGESFATLGERLALTHSRISFASALDAGATEMNSIVLVEVGADGLRTRTEFFATDRLAEAVVRLYERDAALLPEGPERDAAARRARGVAAILALAPLEPLEDHFTPATEFVDHRVLGLGAFRGIEVLRRSFPSLRGLADDLAVRVDDVLALDRNAFLLRSTLTGTERESGGRFERPMLQIRCLAADGRIARSELFETDREAAALARFDELTRADAPLARRVRSNAATANIARLDAAMAARDMAAVEAIFAAFVEAFHHPLQTRYERDGAIESLRMTLASRDLVFHNEPIASLGERLALCRQRMSSGGVARGDVDVGGIDVEHVWLIEVDEEGRRVRAECFAATDLAAAIARLYERYAELSPEGAARERAATTARCVGALMRVELESIGALSTDDCELHDHRRLGFFTGRGRAALERSVRVQRELSDELSFHVDEILDLAADAFLTRSRLLGRNRLTGGRIEREQLSLRCFSPDGRQTRADLFDPDQEAQARALFAARAGAPSRRVQPNAASAAAHRVAEMVATRDAAALEPLFGGVEEFVEHATGASVPGSALVETWGALLRARDSALRQELLATLGDALALVRGSMTFSGLTEGDLDAPFGAVERNDLVLIEVDGAGRPRRFESFPPDALGAALVRLYERHAELAPEGPERERAAATAHHLGLDSLEPEAVRRRVAADVELVDHRTAGLPPMRGAGAVARVLAAAAEITEEAVDRLEDVVAAEPHALLTRWTTVGRVREGGGDFEWSMLLLGVFGADGRTNRIEVFDVDRSADALARFDALATPTAPSRRIAPNEATACAAAIVAAFAARDLDALAAQIAETSETIHHPSGASWGTEGALASWRLLSEGRDAQFRLDPVATLGTSLALCLQSARAGGRAIDDAGDYEMDHWVVWETDPAGRMAHAELFAHDRLGDAFIRLYERRAEGTAEGSTRERAATTARCVAGLLRGEPALVKATEGGATEFRDHRRLGLLGSGRVSNDDVARYRESFSDLTEDVSIAVDEILCAQPDAYLVRTTTRGRDRRSGGAFEQTKLDLRCFDAAGRLLRGEWFDADREADALARFDELRSESPPSEYAAFVRRAELVAGLPAESFGNAAWRADLDSNRAWRERRWDDVVAAYRPDFELIDRRSMTGVDLRGSDFLRNLRLIFDTPGSEWHTNLIATRGERLVLLRALLIAELRERGRVEWEHLGIFEFDAHGRRKSLVLFDMDHVDAAYAELDARYAAGEGAPHARLLATFAELARAWGARDRPALERLAHESFTTTPHQRLVGLGETHDRAGWIARCGVLDTMGVEDEAVRVDHLRISPRAALRAGVVRGTREGGAFEIPLVFAYAHDGTRLLSQDLYDGDQVEEALARYQALSGEGAPSAPSDPLARWLVPNAAVAAHARLDAASSARDWAAMRARFAPNARVEDRRAGLRTPAIDADTAVAWMRDAARRDPRMRSECRLFAVFGDRVSLETQTWRGGPPDGPYEIEMLTLIEADTEGRVAALVSFDPGDVVAACREAAERWIAIEPRFGPLVRAGLAYAAASRTRDAETLRALLADDLVVEDRRRTGFGPLAGGDALVDSFRAVWQLTQEAVSVVRARLACEPWGSVLISHITGTLADGGAFEGLNGSIAIFEDGRFRRLEFFELEDMEDALARFDAMRAERERRDPLRIPENTATQADLRWGALVAARDWDGLREHFAPDLVWEDRRRLFGASGGRDALLANVRLIADARFTVVERSLLATSGDRLSLKRNVFRGGDPGAPVEVEMLQLLEVDQTGRIVAAVSFDADDRRAAALEMFERFWANTDEGRRATAAQIALNRAIFAHDVAAMRAALPDDFRFDDHRRTGLGAGGGPDDFVAWMAAGMERSDDLAVETLGYLAIAEHGTLSVGRAFGRLRDGGEFESVVLRINRLDGDRWIGVEVYEPEDLERAKARFTELGRAYAAPAPNAAWDAWGPLAAIVQAGDWDALRARVTPDFEFEDRRRLSLVRGDFDLYVRNLEFVRSWPGRRVERTLLATAGDRLALDRIAFVGDPDGGAFTGEFLRITELDAQGRLRAVLHFDDVDAAAAEAELAERHARLGEAGSRSAEERKR